MKNFLSIRYLVASITRFFIRKKLMKMRLISSNLKKMGLKSSNLKKISRKSRGPISKLKCFYWPKTDSSSLLHSKY